jgi:hypothetical protein
MGKANLSDLYCYINKGEPLSQKSEYLRAYDNGTYNNQNSANANFYLLKGNTQIR